jgi:hypothetical protein
MLTKSPTSTQPVSRPWPVAAHRFSAPRVCEVRRHGAKEKVS